MLSHEDERERGSKEKPGGRGRESGGENVGKGGGRMKKTEPSSGT